MAGTRITQFEGHLAEIMWRSQAKGNVYVEFFDLLRSVYTLEQPAEYMYRFPVFDTWSGGSIEDTIEPGISGAESESESSQDEDADTTLTSLDNSTDMDSTLTQHSRGATGHSSSSTPRTVTHRNDCTIPRVRQQEHVCHPQGFQEEKREGPRTKTTKRKQQRKSNPYAKSAFLIGADWRWLSVVGWSMRSVNSVNRREMYIFMDRNFVWLRNKWNEMHFFLCVPI